ncbi:MAG: cytochrome P450 [Myxococcota bacterium]
MNPDTATSTQERIETAVLPSAPPGPARWPLVGNLPGLLWGGMGWLTSQEAAFGDIYTLDLGAQRAVLLSHPDYAQHVLRTHARNYVKQGTFWSSVRSLLGQGLPTSEGELWKKRRKMMNPQFRKNRVQQLGQVMAEVIAEQLDAWPAEGQVVKGSHLVNQVTMAVIVRTMFGTGLSVAQSDAITEAMSFSLDHMLQKVFTDALPSWVPVPGRRAHREAVARIDEVLYAVLEKRRAGAPGNDLLTMMMLMRDEESGKGLSDVDLRDETMSLFVAGYETTATAVSWVIDRMASDPAFAATLQEEADRVLGDRPPQARDAQALPYARRVFQETLRMQGPVYFLAREAVEDDVIGGHHIEAGSLVSLMLNRIHRHPAAWDDPETFDPDRFLPERSKGRHPCAFVAFGAGQRQCIGKGFALLEGTLLLSAIAQRFRFEPVSGKQAAEQYAITYRPRNGMPLRIYQR